MNDSDQTDDGDLLKPWAATVKGAKSEEAGSGGFYPYFE